MRSLGEEEEGSRTSGGICVKSTIKYSLKSKKNVIKNSIKNHLTNPIVIRVKWTYNVR